MIILGAMLFSVRWNTINGKLTGLCVILGSANFAYLTWTADKEKFVPQPQYAYATTMGLAGLHLMFNANPMIKKADDKKSN